MSWIKIEVQKGNPKRTVESSVEPIDYEKIREITREVVKEEMKEQQNNQSASLTKEDIQEAICDAIIHANDINEKKETERIENTKIPILAKFFMCVIGLIAGLLVIASCVVFFSAAGALWDRAYVPVKLVSIAALFFFVDGVLYLMLKNRRMNFIISMLSLLLAFGSIVFTLLSE